MALIAAALISSLVLLRKRSPEEGETAAPLPKERPLSGTGDSPRPKEEAPATDAFALRMAAARAGNQVQPPLMQEISESSKTLTPAQAEIFLKRIKDEIPGLWDRAGLGNQIIGYLCVNGYADEAWKLIDPGFGEMRTEQLRGYFAFASEAGPAAIGKINQLTDTKERNVALSGYISKFPMQDLLQLDFKSLAIKTDAERSVIANCFSSYLASAAVGQSGDELKEAADKILAGAAELAGVGVISPADLGKLLTTDRSGDSFEDWGKISAVGTDSQAEAPPGLQQAKDRIAEQMIQQDAKKAIHFLTSSEDPACIASIEPAITEWLARDNQAATEWSRSAFPKLPEPQKNRVAVAFAKTGIKYGELDSAREWISQISDEATRTTLTKKLEARTPVN